jgi:hypothetical protein
VRIAPQHVGPRELQAHGSDKVTLVRISLLATASAQRLLEPLKPQEVSVNAFGAPSKESVNMLSESPRDVATVVVCPNCGYRFNRPFVSERQFGVGFSFAPLGMGLLTCPSCKTKAQVFKFKKTEEPPSPPVSTVPGDVTPGQTATRTGGDGEKKDDSVDDSKYE